MQENNTSTNTNNSSPFNALQALRNVAVAASTREESSLSRLQSARLQARQKLLETVDVDSIVQSMQTDSLSSVTAFRLQIEHEALRLEREANDRLRGQLESARMQSSSINQESVLQLRKVSNEQRTEGHPQSLHADFDGLRYRQKPPAEFLKTSPSTLETEPSSQSQSSHNSGKIIENTLVQVDPGCEHEQIQVGDLCGEDPTMLSDMALLQSKRIDAASVHHADLNNTDSSVAADKNIEIDVNFDKSSHAPHPSHLASPDVAEMYPALSAAVSRSAFVPDKPQSQYINIINTDGPSVSGNVAVRTKTNSFQTSAPLNDGIEVDSATSNVEHQININHTTETTGSEHNNPSVKIQTNELTKAAAKRALVDAMVSRMTKDDAQSNIAEILAQQATDVRSQATAETEQIRMVDAEIKDKLDKMQREWTEAMAVVSSRSTNSTVSELASVGSVDAKQKSTVESDEIVSPLCTEVLESTENLSKTGLMETALHKSLVQLQAMRKCEAAAVAALRRATTSYNQLKAEIVERDKAAGYIGEVYGALSEAYTLQKEKLANVLEQQKEYRQEAVSATVASSNCFNPRSTANTVHKFANDIVNHYPNSQSSVGNIDKTVASAAAAAAHNQLLGNISVKNSDAHYWTFAQSTIMLALGSLQRCETDLRNASYDNDTTSSVKLQQIAKELADTQWLLCHCAYPIPAAGQLHHPSIQRIVKHIGQVVGNAANVRRNAEVALTRLTKPAESPWPRPGNKT